MTAFADLTAAAMTEGFADRSLSPVEVTRAVLDRIDASEPVLNAMWTVDNDVALEAARASEERWRRGAPLTVGGVSLDGVPITVKENIATRGVPMPLGTAVSDMTPRTEDAPPAARMREAVVARPSAVRSSRWNVWRNTSVPRANDVEVVVTLEVEPATREPSNADPAQAWHLDELTDDR